MRDRDFEFWLERIYKTAQGRTMERAARQSRLSNCRHVEEYEGDLDGHFAKDQMAGLLKRLTYGRDEDSRNVSPRHRIPIDGDRTSVVVTPYQQAASTTSYTTNTLNQYTVVGGTNRSHDSNGNVTDDGTHKFKYNYKNLICEVRLTSNNNLVAEYKYDANGRRVEKVVSGGITERYVYSGVETVATYNGSNTWKQDFVFGQGIDRIVMLSQADVLDYDGDQNTSETTRSFYHRNALGSVMEITDLSQAKAVSYRYTPYGEVTITRGGQSQSTDPLGQHVCYNSRHDDVESQTTFNRLRTYRASEGVFRQRDPLEYAKGPNLYSYVRGSPVSRRDPLGLAEMGFSSSTIYIPFAATVPAELPQALRSMAWMDQWLGLTTSSDGSSFNWFTRLRDNYTVNQFPRPGPDDYLGFRIEWRQVQPENCVFQGTVQVGSLVCELWKCLWEEVKIHKGRHHWWEVSNYEDRNGYRGRQDWIYGEYVRGRRKDERIDQWFDYEWPEVMSRWWQDVYRNCYLGELIDVSSACSDRKVLPGRARGGCGRSCGQ